MSRRTSIAATAVVVALAIAVVALTGALTTRAVQNPSVSFDMVTSGNAYDDTTNTMTVGTVDNCLTSATANTATHVHAVQIVIQNVEDLVGWQGRMNYIGDQFRPNTVNFIPFADSNTGQNISFLNLPIEAGIHRDLVTATDIPASAPGPQSALIGSVYNGAQSFAISPDTPAKTTPDDTSYSAPSGGVLASITLQVVGNQSGNPSLFVNMDDASPNSPGTDLQIFTGTGITTLSIPPERLGDAFHGEGATCVPLNCTTQECPSVGTATPVPTATATATAAATATATAAATATATAPPGTGTATATATAGPVDTGTATATPSPTEGPIDTGTPTATAEPGQTPTATPTEGPIDTGTPTATAEPGQTPTETPTATATAEPGVTDTPTPTATATQEPGATETPTATATPEASPTPTRTPGVQVGLDHFKCYETDRADGAERFESRSVDVVDLFTDETLRLSKPEAGCFPADKNNEGVNDETAHLLCYQLSRNRENVDEQVRITNQFGELQLHVHRAELFCVPAEADGVTSALALDHFKCYNAHRDGGPRFNSQGGVILEDRFGTDTVKVDNVETFCTPADKENEGILDPDTALVCYDLDNGDDQDEDVTFEDQFGEVTVEIEDTEELCVPSTFEVLTEEEEDDDDDDDDD